MITLKDVLVEEHDWQLSLVKLVGLKVKDIRGYITTEFGDPVIKLTEIEFEDGTELCCEGEHDMPYVVTYATNAPANTDSETLERLYEEGQNCDD